MHERISTAIRMVAPTTAAFDRVLEAPVWRTAAAIHRDRVLDLVHGSVTIDPEHPM